MRTPDSSVRETVRVVRPEKAGTRRYFITSKGEGTLIRAVPTRPAGRTMDVAPSEPAPPETVADDRRHFVNMRRFLRTTRDRAADV